MGLTSVSKDIKAKLLVVAMGKHMWAFSEPDNEGLRVVKYNDKEQGKGILLGSVVPIGLSYIAQSDNIEVGQQLGVKFPDQPESKSLFFSTPITTIMIGEEKSKSGEYLEKRVRILPRKPTDIRPHPRVKVLGEDHAGFTIVEAQLKPGEGVCWRCGSIADDPDGTLEICPVCGGDFND